MGDESTINGTLDWIPDAVLILGAGGRILIMNAAAERLFSYSRAELIGRSIQTCLPAVLCDRCLELLDPAGKPGPCTVEVLELEARRKDGSRFPVEVSLASFKVDNDARLAATVRDISRRKQAELALRQSETRFRMLVEEVKDYAIFMLDTEGRIMSWNKGAERMRGCTADEAIGRHYSVFSRRRT